MENLGEMADVATSELELTLEKFWPCFAMSDMAKQIEAGTSRTCIGMSGTEIALGVCDQMGLPYPASACRSLHEVVTDPVRQPRFLRLGRAYWCGWIVALYQWETRLSFAEIQRYLPITMVERMYATFHEEAEDRFIEAANEMIAAVQSKSGLKRQRTLLGLSQSQLARRSGVGLRAIQQYEQGAKDISRASYDRVQALARALHCQTQDLLSQPSRYEYAVIDFPE